MLNPMEIKRYEEYFLEQKQTLMDRQKVIDQSLEIGRDDMTDEMDLSSLEQAQAMRLRLKGREILFLSKIEEALHRIEEGTFGACEECSEPIEAKRLEVRPTTTRCISCKEEQEHLESQMIDGRQNSKKKSPPRLRLVSVS